MIRKRALLSVALLQQETCKLGHSIHLHFRLQIDIFPPNLHWQNRPPPNLSNPLELYGKKERKEIQKLSSNVLSPAT